MFGCVVVNGVRDFCCARDAAAAFVLAAEAFVGRLSDVNEGCGRKLGMLDFGNGSFDVVLGRGSAEICCVLVLGTEASMPG